MTPLSKSSLVGLAALAAIAAASQARGHGDVTPQAVDTAGLPELGEEWLAENPWREPGTDVWRTAVSVGASGYNQNCARCHGLEVVSGGLAPDLRYLEADDYGDEWFLERFRHGYTQNGVTRMPAFGELLGQEAAWAIRTYIETRPDDGALDEFDEDLREYRAALHAWAEQIEGGEIGIADIAAELESMKASMAEIAGQVPTASGAEMADSIARRASLALDGSDGSVKDAAEILTIGLSAAQ